MRVLWLVNLPLPEVSLLMNETPSPFGGWLINASHQLSKITGIELSIAFPKKEIKEFVKLKGDRISYYIFRPVKDSENKLINDNYIFRNILHDANPDIVHIHGTEMPHTLSMVNVCNKVEIESVISIQGLVSVISKHIYANLPWRVVYGATLRNILRKDNVRGLRKLFFRRGKKEIEAIKRAKYVIGRTTWDKACITQINPNVTYYHCNESLREEFYKNEWNIQDCEKHSIFLSQGHYPIKGVHFLIEAMPLILQRFPDAKAYISGKDITKSETIKDKIMTTYYGNYIAELIHHYKLEKKIVFTGLLDEKQMCQRYLKSHVFVCPSSIENSPNSLGEAMILGVPCVASYVGGVPDMLRHGEEGFVYQADAPYMLAYYVCELFENTDLALYFSRKARKHAMSTHNRETNTKRLVQIYKSILEKRHSL